MKKFETLRKEVENENIVNVVDDIIECCADVNLDTLTKKEMLACLALNEIKKSIDNKSRTLVFDCNFKNSKFHDTHQYLIDYACIVANEDVNTRLIQIYTTVTNDFIKFRLHTTCKRSVLTLNTLQDELQYEVQYNKKTNKAKTSKRANIAYDDVVNVIKDTLAVLDNK